MRNLKSRSIPIINRKVVARIFSVISTDVSDLSSVAVISILRRVEANVVEKSGTRNYVCTRLQRQAYESGKPRSWSTSHLDDSFNEAVVDPTTKVKLSWMPVGGLGFFTVRLDCLHSDVHRLDPPNLPAVIPDGPVG